MKKIVLLLCIALMMALSLPVLAEEAGSIRALLAGDERYGEYAILAATPDVPLPCGMAGGAVISNGAETLLVLACDAGEGWQMDGAWADAVYQPGDNRGTDVQLRFIGEELWLGYGSEEMYHFFLEADAGQYVLSRVEYGSDENYGDVFTLDSDGMMFWQSGIENTFTPIGEAMWCTQAIPLEAFRIAQMPRSLADVRRMNIVSLLLAEGSPVTLVTAVDTATLPGDAQAQLPAGTQVTGAEGWGPFLLRASWTDESGAIRSGFLPTKDVHPLYDVALTTGADRLYGDARWDVMDALQGKWNPVGGAAWGRLILAESGTFRNHMPDDRTAHRVEGNFRVYGGEGGLYEVLFLTEDNSEYRCRMALNADGTITLIGEETQTTLQRDEYSTYGNG